MKPLIVFYVKGVGILNKMLREDHKYDLTDKVTLTKEQNEGIEFLLSQPNRILGFKTGMGKTITSLTSALHIMNHSPNSVCFIVCPKSANTAFIKELSKRLCVKYSVYTTELRQVTKGSRFLIFNYSNVDEMIRYLYAVKKKGYKAFGLFDEVHMVGSAISGLAKKLNAVRGEFSFVIGMTATVLSNDLENMYRVVNFIRPGFLGTLRDFQNRYIIYKEKKIRVQGGKTRKIREVVGYRNLEELSNYMKNLIIIRGKEYKLKFIYKSCTLSEYEEGVYEKAANGVLDTDSEKVIAARLHDLQRVADGSHIELKSGELYSKVKLLIEVLREVVTRGEGVLIYTEYEDTYRMLGKAIEKYKGYIGFRRLYYITGKVKYDERVSVEKNLGKKDICLITKAGCASLNLQAVNNVVYYDTPFSIEKFIQAVGRITRIDTEYSTQNVIILEAEDTIDTYKKLLIQQHTALIEILFGKEGNLPNIKDIDTESINKYRSWFKQKFLWKNR